MSYFLGIICQKCGEVAVRPTYRNNPTVTVATKGLWRLSGWKIETDVELCPKCAGAVEDRHDP